MEDKLFDQHIRKELEKIQPDLQENQWAEMEQRLDLEFGEIMEIEEQVSFDTEVQQKLSDHQVPMNSRHWAQLKNRLDLEDDRVRKVYVSKVFEISLFILLILFFLQIKQNETPIYRSYPSMASSTNTGAENINDKQILTDKNQILSGQELNSSLFVETLIESNENNTTSATDEFYNSNINFDGALASSDVTNIIEVELLNSLPSVGLVYSSSHVPPVSELLFADLTIIQPTATQLNNLALLDLCSLAFDRDKYQLTLPTVQPAKAKSKSNWLNISASRDANLLNETVFAVLDPDSLIGTYGSSFSLGYSKQKGHFEIETALTYSNKNIPINQTQISGSSQAYYKSSVINSQLHVAQIPLIGKYHFTPQNKIGFYAGTGINLNFLMHSKELVEELNLDFPKPSSFVGVPESNKSFVAELSQEGLLEGGKFIHNTYLSVNFILGLQARITPGISAFFQPVYQHHIFREKLGPNEDKIHVLSLQLGTKFKF